MLSPLDKTCWTCNPTPLCLQLHGDRKFTYLSLHSHVTHQNLCCISHFLAPLGWAKSFLPSQSSSTSDKPQCQHNRTALISTSLWPGDRKQSGARRKTELWNICMQTLFLLWPWMVIVLRDALCSWLEACDMETAATAASISQELRGEKGNLQEIFSFPPL